MNDDDRTALFDRIAALERRVRSLRSSLCSCLLAALAVLSMAFVARSDEIRASKFTLVDDLGAVRGVWTARTDESGDPRLEMRNHAGKTQLELDVTRETAMIVLRDEKEQNRVGMAVEGFPHLLMHDAGQKPRLHMTVGKSGAPTILFIHEDGSLPGGFGVGGDGVPWIKPDEWMTALGKRGREPGDGR